MIIHYQQYITSSQKSRRNRRGSVSQKLGTLPGDLDGVRLIEYLSIQYHTPTQHGLKFIYENAD
jgi:hypothetical protein